MTLKRSFVSVLALVVTITLFAPQIVRADAMDKKIIVSFNKPVKIPNLRLEPGTYVFKLADHGNIPSVVQVFNQDETEIYATLFTIPKYRETVSDQPVFQFEERNQGEPMAIDAWFYPGENTGYEFVYSKDFDVESAAEPAGNVTPDNTAAVPSLSEVPAPPELTALPPQIETVETVRIIAFLVAPEAPIPDPAGASTNSTAPSEAAAATTPQLRELPKTASNLPLLALFGMLSLGSAAILHAGRRLSAYFARN
jgi:LPXTG-motif cell wall-anchored protein